MNMEVEVAVVGGGPAGLMAAEVLSENGISVHVFDGMSSVGRKFLMAGRGGLNLTHSEDPDVFAGRYGERRSAIEALLNQFGAAELRSWALGLGIETFVGTSGRVFPKGMKAAPLLRAWLHRLFGSNKPVQFHMRHRWVGFAEGKDSVSGCPPTLLFDCPEGRKQVQAQVVVLALGGGSWARLGSNGAWVPFLMEKGVAVAPLLPANCGFDVQGGWSPFFVQKYAGQPFKSVALKVTSASGLEFSRKGEFVATSSGVEGSLIYAAAALLRNSIARDGKVQIHLDLLPHLSAEKVFQEVVYPRGSRTLTSHLKSRLKLDGIKSALLHEVLTKDELADPHKLAGTIKSAPLTLQAARPIDEAISTAGGVLFEVLSPELMLEQLPGVFCAGEMLDWEAPTGGYLLTACFASGRAAGMGAVHWLKGR